METKISLSQFEVYKNVLQNVKIFRLQFSGEDLAVVFLSFTNRSPVHKTVVERQTLSPSTVLVNVYPSFTVFSSQKLYTVFKLSFTIFPFQKLYLVFKLSFTIFPSQKSYTIFKPSFTVFFALFCMPLHFVWLIPFSCTKQCEVYSTTPFSVF